MNVYIIRSYAFRNIILWLSLLAICIFWILHIFWDHVSLSTSSSYLGFAFLKLQEPTRFASELLQKQTMERNQVNRSDNQMDMQFKKLYMPYPIFNHWRCISDLLHWCEARLNMVIRPQNQTLYPIVFYSLKFSWNYAFALVK